MIIFSAVNLSEFHFTDSSVPLRHSFAFVRFLASKIKSWRGGLHLLYTKIFVVVVKTGIDVFLLLYFALSWFVES